MRQLPHEGVKNEWEGTRKQKGLLTAPTHHAGLATIPSSLLRIGSVRRLDSLCLWDRDQTSGETNSCIVEVTLKDILDQNAHFLCEDGTSWCRTYCPQLRIAMTWPFQSFKKYLRVRDIHRLEELVRHGFNELGRSCIQYLCFASGSLELGHAGTLISGLRRYVLLARPCGADMEDHQSVFRTVWRVHRSCFLAIPPEFRTPVSHDIVLSVATSACSEQQGTLVQCTRSEKASAVSTLERVFSI